MLINYLRNEIDSDTSVEWSLAIQGLNNNPEQLEKLWKDIVNPNREFSYYKLTYVLMGFWSTLKISYNKDKYICKLYEELP